MEITFLGTGTSYGVPVIACDCAVCTSSNPKNKRTRSSLWIVRGGVSILIDTAIEFRLQALRSQIEHVDGVLYTHCHADHVFGLDDLRIFSRLSQKNVPVYGSQATLEELRRVFAYVFEKGGQGGEKPQITTNVIDSPFWVQGVPVVPIPIYHGALPILGYRLGNLAYLTDCSYIPPASRQLLQGLDVLILGVIRHRPHPTHMNVEQALKLVDELRPRRTFFTHISHLLEHDETNDSLPPNVNLAYDGLQIRCA